jgi:arylsulfatase A-like enzyme
MRNWNIAEPTSGYTTEVFTDEAIRIIKEKNQQPFFIYLSPNAVHGPMDARDQDIMDYPFKDPKRKKFSGLLKSFDDQTGRLMNALKKTNQYENTLIFFMSDNGGPSDHNGSSNWPLRGKKGSEFEGGNRSPFIVQWPEKIPASLESNIPVIAYDIFATSIAAAGGDLAPDREYHGQDIMKVLDQSYNAQRPLFWSRGTNFAIREGKWKLLITENENSLFNLEEDQTEKHDLSAKYPEVKEALNKKLLVWKASHTQALWSSGYKTKKHKKAVK